MSTNPIDQALADLKVASDLGPSEEAETHHTLEQEDGLVGLYFRVHRWLHQELPDELFDDVPFGDEKDWRPSMIGWQDHAEVVSRVRVDDDPFSDGVYKSYLNIPRIPYHPIRTSVCREWARQLLSAIHYEASGERERGFIGDLHKLYLADKGEPAPADNGKADKQSLALEPDDRKILEALAKARTTQVQVDLEADTGLSRKTISSRLKRLRAAGLTYQPNGQRRGEAITDPGRQALG